MNVGDQVVAFDKIEWKLAGRPEDKEPFWKLAVILKINESHHNVPETVTIHFYDNGPRSTDHGHRMEDFREYHEGEKYICS